MKLRLLLFVFLFLAVPTAQAREFNVSVQGNDANDGSAQSPYKTISAAAQAAQPGDVITVHAGVYRERINPPRGGTSDDKRIVYQAAPGEKVEIAGSEEVKNWVKVQNDTWKTSLPNTFFGSFNPYRETIHGDWLNPDSRQHHPGAVYLNSEERYEAPKMDDVLKPAAAMPLWFAQVDNDTTTIWAQFKGIDPNGQHIEINARQTVFYPEKAGINYITVRGFTLRDAATPWAPPTAEQIGLVGPHWGKGWIIENNVVFHSTCVGVSLGKYGDEWDNKEASAAGYIETIKHAEQNNWNGDTVGHHIVRNNTISECGQAGVVGSLGAIFSQITGNHIFNIANRGQLNGFERAGIKIHAAIDVLIKGNRIHDCDRGIWMDWMAQGTHISGNLCYHNISDDLFMEVDHGPYLVDNNLFLSRISLTDRSEGGAYVHNLMTGAISTHPDKQRSTPYFKAHSTEIAGYSNILGGDDRYFNNIFVGPGASGAVPHGRNYNAARDGIIGFSLSVYDTSKFPPQTGGNVYYQDAHPYAQETDPVKADTDPKIQITDDGDHAHLPLTLGPAIAGAKTVLVTTALLGNARVPNLPYENPDGTPLQIDTDYFGKKRDPAHPSPGPFENPGPGTRTLDLW